MTGELDAYFQAEFPETPSMPLPEIYEKSYDRKNQVSYDPYPENNRQGLNIPGPSGRSGHTGYIDIPGNSGIQKSQTHHSQSNTHNRENGKDAGDALPQNNKDFFNDPKVRDAIRQMIVKDEVKVKGHPWIRKGFFARMADRINRIFFSFLSKDSTGN